MLAKSSIDFHYIEPKHAEIDARLRNWGIWCRNPAGSSVSPMFRLYRPAEHWEGQSASIPVDKIDAQKIAKGVSGLPESHRHSLAWFYISPCTPGRAAKSLGTTLQGLATYVHDSRLMLINRGI